MIKGVYVLMIKVKKDIKLTIGSLGRLSFKKGSYAYVGSAQNNLEKRVKRHLSNNKKLHWHIDYLLNNKSASIIKVFYKKAGKQEECGIASRLSLTKDSISGFGCSDCKCGSHLFKLSNGNLSNLGVKVL